MTRTEKIERIRKYRRYLYIDLFRVVPNLVNNPEEATSDEIYTYNQIIASESIRDRNNVTFKKNFSF